jgi:hypothetical protein
MLGILIIVVVHNVVLGNLLKIYVYLPPLDYKSKHMTRPIFMGHSLCVLFEEHIFQPPPPKMFFPLQNIRQFLLLMGPFSPLFYPFYIFILFS